MIFSILQIDYDTNFSYILVKLHLFDSFHFKHNVSMNIPIKS